MIFFDTNVLVYVFAFDEPNHQKRAARLLEKHTKDNTLVISTQVLQEFYNTITKKFLKSLDEKSISAVMKRFAKLPTVQVDSAIILSAVQRHQKKIFLFGMRLS